MTKLKELERRLKDEPDNLGLRVTVAGVMIEAGRRADAVELYRSVAIAYRDLGRPQQATMVCRNILELAPDDAACHALLVSLTEPAPRLAEERYDEAPARRSSQDMTPLPPPLPYHVAEPTAISQLRLSRADLPPSLREELALGPEIEGIASAARQISASLIAASRLHDEAEERAVDDLLGDDADDDAISTELDTRKLARIDRAELDDPPPLPPVEPGDDELTIPPGLGGARARAVDDEKTEPRELPIGIRTEPRARPPSIAPPTQATGPLASVLFAPIPPRDRAAVLQRFHRRVAAVGTTVIRRGEAGHGLVMVVRGQLDVHAERSDGARVSLDAIGPGDHVGEIGLVSRTPAAAYVVAAMDSELLVLSAPDFYEVTGAYPALWAQLSKVAARRTRDHAERLQA